MNAFIVFDVTENATKEVVDELHRLGYWQAWLSDGVKFNLPLNCVWKPNSELQTGLKDIETVIEKLNLNREDPKIKLLRCIVLSNTPWVAIPVTPTPA
jgi:hypothetical protein